MTQRFLKRCPWVGLIGVALSGCGADAAPEESSAPQGKTAAAILNGSPVANADIHVYLTDPIPGSSALDWCSGTLITNRWVLTVGHCEMSLAGTIRRGNDVRGVAQVIRHPELDIALVQSTTAFPSVYPTSMYPWDPSRLVGQIVDCYGYGHNTTSLTGGGTLRRGSLEVVWADADELVLEAADGNNQLAYYGDSGGACVLRNTSRAVIGVILGGDGDVPTYNVITPTSAFSRWALPIIEGSAERIACIGRECVTNPVPLPHRLFRDRAWQPCPGQLSAPGNYTFDYEAQYSFEYNFDWFLVDGQYRTGTGTASGTTVASHLGHQVGVTTDRNVASQGLSWLRARCPGDP